MPKYTKFPYQVGGHHLMLRHPQDPTKIIKPLFPKEHKFYQEAPAHALTKHVPAYFGVIDLQADADGCREDNLGKCIVLEDLTHSLAQPCIIDIKMGHRLYDNDAGPEKRERMIRKSRESSSQKVGWRISGMRYFVPSPAREPLAPPAWIVKGKKELRGLQCEDLPLTLAAFLAPLSATDRPKVVERFVGDLKEIYAALSVTRCLLYSSSILLIYDADDALGKMIHCKMIDFVHCVFCDDTDEYPVDYLSGLRNLIAHFQDL